ncbi:MAG: NUDIX hydrolase [Rhizobiales bacterium]|nr:NUDIX hydrolase [Hyphomicrobiales bacterium]
MSSAPALPKLGASACVWRAGRVLIVQRGKPPLAGIWSLPGGAVEPGETAMAAAARELAEETGVTAALERLVDLVDIIRYGADGSLAFHYAVACYTGLWTSGEPVPASDALDARFAEISELDGLKMTEGTPAIIRRARELLGA